MRRDMWSTIALGSLTLIAFLVRLISASFSSMPYNIDGFPLAKIAEGIAHGGGWSIGGTGLILYNSKMPGVPLVLAMFYRLTGIPPLESIRFILPLVGASTVLSGGYLSYKITDNRIAAFGSASFFAFSGFFLYLTSAAMKQVLGMALMPIAFILFLDRDKKTSSLLLLVLLLALVLIHHLSFLLLASILGIATAFSIVSCYIEGSIDVKSLVKRETPTAAVLGISAAFGWWYYSASSLEHMEYVPGREKILLGMVFVLWIILGSLLFLSKDMEKRSRKTWIKPIMVVSIFVFAIAVNHYKPIFGVMPTTTLFAILITPYLLFMAFPLTGLEIVRSTASSAKPLLLAGVIGPIVFLTFSVSSGLDVVSLGLLSRSFSFMDVSLGIFAGIGLAHVYNRASFTALKRALPTIFVCIALLTVPLAYNSIGMYGVKDVTEDHEFYAMSVAAEIALEHNLTVYTDQRFGDIMGPYFGVRTEKNLPYKLQETQLPQGLLLLSSEWMDTGAQVFPFPNVKITPGQFDNILESTNLVFHLGPEGREVYLLSTVPLS